MLEDESTVYKLVGPVLVKQELFEAKSNVQKRIDYIEGDIQRLDDRIKSLQKKQDEKRTEVAQIQGKMQAVVQRAMGAAAAMGSASG